MSTMNMKYYKFESSTVMSWSSSSFMFKGCQLSKATTTLLNSLQAHKIPLTVIAMGVTNEATPKATEFTP